MTVQPPPGFSYLPTALRTRSVDATPWARAANFVKKPPLIVNVTYLELNGFNASMWVSLLHALIDVIKFIGYV